MCAVCSWMAERFLTAVCLVHFYNISYDFNSSTCNSLVDFVTKVSSTISDVAFSDGKVGNYLFAGNFVYTVSIFCYIFL